MAETPKPMTARQLRARLARLTTTLVNKTKDAHEVAQEIASCTEQLAALEGQENGSKAPVAAGKKAD